MKRAKGYSRMLSLSEASTNIGSKRQFRLIRSVGSTAGRGRWCVTEAPAHRRLAHATINYDLHGAARAICGSQEHAFLKFYGLGQGSEGPQLAIVQQQNDTTAVRQAAGLDRGMEMEADS